ncbi:response regulator [Chryseobacterium sp. SN22]|uniref:response regulator n=1 Tax=Chryseobacterium sp. SN22 TaxID=2606431 RepID=UPI0011EDA00A|nr:response regulator [Chryseobacterium sp. SN22]KAA0127273.1 response regulator [Chryseobacterium sp. SN22]
MKNKTILVCDDEEGILDVVEMMLDAEGFTVYTELESAHVLSRIREHAPDLLIVDLWMPVMSGDEVIRKIRGDKEVRSLPIMVMSASRDGEGIAFEAGADRFISKPFDIGAFVSKVEELIG